MLDTVASNKTAQVTLGVLQQPQSTIVNYYCVVNCYYFVSLVVPSVMTCIATLSAVMRWVFVHYLSGEKYWGLLLNWQNDRGIGIRGVELAKRWTHHKLVARSTAKGLLLAVLHSWEKTSCPSTVSSSFFFFSLLLVTPQTHPRRHTYTYMRNSPFPVLLCSQSSFPINPVYLRQLFEVILYGSRLHLFCGALNGHFWVVNNRASLCGVWSVNTHSSVTGSYLIVSPVSPNPHRELFAFFSVILKDVYWTV